jgi:hypothetical protein
MVLIYSLGCDDHTEGIERCLDLINCLKKYLSVVDPDKPNQNTIVKEHQ